MQDATLSDDEDNCGKGSLGMKVGYSRTQRGWAGSNIELQRDDDIQEFKANAAVDLNQFRNTQIGVGYQAKHVVRQRSNPKPTMVVTDLRSNLKKRKSDEVHENDNIQLARLRHYLNNVGLRNFRRELASIEESS